MIDTLAFVLTGIGLAASIVYYANILNNANKTRELQLKAQEQALETRQAQMFIQIYNQYSSNELKQALRILKTLKWNSFEEFANLFDPENPETIETTML